MVKQISQYHPVTLVLELEFQITKHSLFPTINGPTMSSQGNCKYKEDNKCGMYFQSLKVLCIHMVFVTTYNVYE